MTKDCVDINNLRDSRILYDKDPPAFSYYLIGIIALSLVIALVWSFAAKKDYVIKSSGTAVSEDRNYIMSAFGGQITEACVSEGDYVSEGDILFKLSSPDYDLQALQYSGMIEADNRKIEQYQKLEESIKTGTNLFDETAEEDKPYYYQYETYLSQLEQKGVDINTYIGYGYTEEELENVIVRNEDSVSEIYYSTLKSIADSVLSLQSEIRSYEVQLEAVTKGQDLYVITASSSGIVHMDTEYKAGMVVQASAVIGSIVSENEQYSVEVYTDANDVALIHVGDEVDVAVDGLAQSVYGTLSGVITYIARDATVDSEKNTSSFLVKIDLSSTYLVSNDGDKVNISNGMPVEARINYDEISYFQYVMEALGVLVRS